MFDHGPLLVVSHPGVLAVNQAVYVQLLSLGWDVRLVVPATWRHEYADVAFPAEIHPELAGRVRGVPVAMPGRPQRHVYLRSTARLNRAVAPRVAFVEQETYSLSGLQWARTLRRAGVPFGLQADENLERPLPRIAVEAERRTLAWATFIAARSPTAAARIRRRRPDIPTPVVPHAVPLWPEVPPRDTGAFTIGFAGRLIPEKGLSDLVHAVAGMPGDVRLRMVGNGPMRDELAALRIGDRPVEVVTGIAHADMPAAYAQMDVLVLPSHTTTTWAEQFGRTLVEALWCGTPVVGSDSGEIPWVVAATGGGLVYPEGDIVALRERLELLRGDPELARRLAGAGREQVALRFGVEAVARNLDGVLREGCGV